MDNRVSESYALGQRVQGEEGSRVTGGEAKRQGLIQAALECSVKESERYFIEGCTNQRCLSRGMP